MNTKHKVFIYTDGACQGNPGPGGWGYLLRYGEHEKEGAGFVAETTNNRMELQAVVEALSALKRESVVDLYTDSQYVRKGMMEWVHAWVKNGWKTASKAPVKNQDIWQVLLALSTQHDITWHWVRGHDGHPENERVDQLARQACKGKSY